MSKNSQQQSCSTKAEIAGEMLKSSEKSTRALCQDLGSSARRTRSSMNRDLNPCVEKQMDAESPKETFLEGTTKAEPAEENARKNDASVKFFAVIDDRLKNM